MNMMNNDREKIVREIAKTSNSIRKKYRFLKTGKMEEDDALERHFKPISEPLKQLVENTVGVEYDDDEAKIEPLSILEDKKGSLHGTSLNNITSTPKRFKRMRIHQLSDVVTSTPIHDVKPRQLLHDKTAPSAEEIYETSPESLVTSVRRSLQTSDGQNSLKSRLGPLAQKYVVAIMSQDKNSQMDYVYGVKFTDKGMMLGDKYFDVDKNDNILINGTKYVGTPGLYELIFMKRPNDKIYTENDLQKYKSILITTNAHRRYGNVKQPVLGNKGLKYKDIIAPLFGKKFGKGIPSAMTLNNNKIDYVHWNDPNELVDRLRLLEASSQAGNNAHDNEILSIIEELYEAGIIIK